MNRYQFVYLVTFVGVFSSLVYVSNIVKAKLRDAGYYISELILVGLPKKTDTPQPTKTPSPLTAVMSSDLAEKAPQVLALLFAVVTSALVYWKFGSSRSYHFCLDDCI